MLGFQPNPRLLSSNPNKAGKQLSQGNFDTTTQRVIQLQFPDINPSDLSVDAFDVIKQYKIKYPNTEIQIIYKNNVVQNVK